MARGNVFILVHPDDMGDNPPQKVKVRYTYDQDIYDGQGNVTDTVTVVPTWQQMAARYEQTFGVLRSATYQGNGQEYYVIEFECSILKGEIQQVFALNKNPNHPDFPNGTSLSAREADIFLQDGTLEL